MSRRAKVKKRPIMPPTRNWQRGASHKDEDGSEATDIPPVEMGLAGADDIVEWLALLMNEMEVSYDELSRRSGVPTRTIKKWFSADLDARTMPKLQTIQACLEALGQSLISTGPSVPIGKDRHFFPIKHFRLKLLEKRLDQAATRKGITVNDLIDSQEHAHRLAIDRGQKGYRRRST